MPDPLHKCSKYFTYSDLIACGTTALNSNIDNLPLDAESWKALANLAVHILDPIRENFGQIELTYGFCSLELSKRIKSNIYPSLDQHCCSEVNRNGKLLCDRGGAAVDFRVPSANSLEIAQWIVSNLPFDRLYFYGSSNPIHVSYSKNHTQQVVLMAKSLQSGKRIPRTVDKDRFIKELNLGF